MTDLKTMIDELEDASREEGTELGEYWCGLCSFWKVVSYGNNEELVNIIKNEIESQYEWFKENFTWVEHRNGHCDKCGRGYGLHRELVWNDDL